MINLDILKEASDLLKRRDIMKRRHNREAQEMGVEIAKMLTNNFGELQSEVVRDKKHRILRTIIASTPWV